ncbi:MAG: ATP-binding cassette domain-containing protein [Bacteroidia bacterium]|jgi:ABC-type bacteriocin/lantibiotic exporter with double-glycine peptidase domain|nr:ATP-binding cassette domain-containing protein [Bacteroidia bacterium]
MNFIQIKDTLKLFLKASKTPFDEFVFQEKNKRYSGESASNLQEFSDVLNEMADASKFIFTLHHLDEAGLRTELGVLTHPLLFFIKNNNSISAAIVCAGEKDHFIIQKANEADKKITVDELFELLHTIGSLKKENLLGQFQQALDAPDNHIIFYSGYPVPSLLINEHNEHASPIKRIFRLLREEKQDISYIYFYAIMMGLVSLALPLGIQAIIGLISGGLFLNSVIVLMLLVIAATIISGWIQVLQLSVVEVLQQRIFAKAAVEFTYRIPRLKIEGLGQSYAPELMNRFFDVLTIQKSLPKILIDLSTAGIQILFGLILLSFYHPLFIFLGLFITFFIFLVFYFTGKKAMETDINSSKYKYKVAYWIEEMARTLTTFKQAGNTPLPMQKMDKLLSNYLKYRQSHFKVLVKQFKAIIAFKTFITAGLLVLGGVLVVERQINLGQFVAAEVIILLVLSSVEKLISTLENVYDVITAADKVGHITDLELERDNGVYLYDLNIKNNFNIKLSRLSYKYDGAKKPILQDVNLTIHEGEKLCITGYNGSGKSTLMKIVAGLLHQYEGKIIVNDLPLKQINLNSYRSIIADNLSDQDIFEGTIEENISLNRTGITLQDIQAAIEQAGLTQFIQSLEKGIFTPLEAGGTFLSKSNKQKLLLARSFAEKPKLLLIDEFFTNAEQSEKEFIMNQLLNGHHTCALLIVSNERIIMEKCDTVLVMQEGKIIASGTYNDLVNKGFI